MSTTSTGWCTRSPIANPETALGGKFLTTPFSDVSTSVQISAYSLVSLTMACKPLFAPTAAVVGLTFDATVSWPIYDWMGVSKAALESASRYLARYLGPDGVRCNLVAAGPLETIAKKAIPGSEEFNNIWGTRAPLGWDSKDLTPDREGRRRAAQRLVPVHDRRDAARRRWPARHRRLILGWSFQRESGDPARTNADCQAGSIGWRHERRRA